MYKVAYCLKCGYNVKVEHFPFGVLHEKPVINEYGYFDLDWCEFPYGLSYTPMPEFPDDWDLLPEPLLELEEVADVEDVVYG